MRRFRPTEALEYIVKKIGSEWKWGIRQKDNNPTIKNIQLKAIRRSSMNGEVNPHQRMVYNWPLITNTRAVEIDEIKPCILGMF